VSELSFLVALPKRITEATGEVVTSANPDILVRVTLRRQQKLIVLIIVGVHDRKWGKAESINETRLGSLHEPPSIWAGWPVLQER
jgi:hypothetical protein